ncbi:MAG: hypothetical protein ACO1RX_21840 [Candidatus Sericytochromatia bacterium]
MGGFEIKGPAALPQSLPNITKPMPADNTAVVKPPVLPGKPETPPSPSQDKVKLEQAGHLPSSQTQLGFLDKPAFSHPTLTLEEVEWAQSVEHSHMEAIKGKGPVQSFDGEKYQAILEKARQHPVEIPQERFSANSLKDFARLLHNKEQGYRPNVQEQRFLEQGLDTLMQQLHREGVPAAKPIKPHPALSPEDIQWAQQVEQNQHLFQQGKAPYEPFDGERYAQLIETAKQYPDHPVEVPTVQITPDEVTQYLEFKGRTEQGYMPTSAEQNQFYQIRNKLLEQVKAGGLELE